MAIDEKAEKLLNDHFRWIADNLRFRNIDGYEVKRDSVWTDPHNLSGECIALNMRDADRNYQILHAFPQHNMFAVNFNPRRFLNKAWNARIESAVELLQDLGYRVEQINGMAEYTFVHTHM